MPKIKKPLEASESNRVTIFVWHPEEKSRPVGHVAMRTYCGGPNGKGNYIRFLA